MTPAKTHSLEGYLTGADWKAVSHCSIGNAGFILVVPTAGGLGVAGPLVGEIATLHCRARATVGLAGNAVLSEITTAVSAHWCRPTIECTVDAVFARVTGKVTATEIAAEALIATFEATGCATVIQTSFGGTTTKPITRLPCLDAVAIRRTAQAVLSPSDLTGSVSANRPRVGSGDAVAGTGGAVFPGFTDPVAALQANIIVFIALARGTGRNTLLASSVDTGLQAITEDVVHTVGIFQTLHTGVAGLIARLSRAGVWPDLAVVHRVTRLQPIAVEAIVTNGIVRRVLAGVGNFVTRVHRASDTVTAIWSDPGLTAADSAGLLPVAVKTVVTVRLVGNVFAQS